MNQQIKCVFMICVVLMLSILVAGCESDKKSSSVRSDSSRHLVTVHASPRTDKLFYTGSVQPVRVNTLVSPVDGVISSLSFHYGQTVQKGQVVLRMSSDKLQNQLHDSVSSYIKSKEAFRNSTLSFQGAKQLYQEKIIARQEYQHEKIQLENNELAYLDAQFKLRQLIKSIPGLDKKLEKVDLENIKNVRKLFDEEFDQLTLSAKQEGIVLFPVKLGSKDSGGSDISVGAEVKKGQALLSVGDLSSLGVQFDVGEMEINKLKAGQRVKVTSPAIPNMVLKGKVTSVAVQAKTTQGYNENAKFPVNVEVESIPERFQSSLRVGMGVRIEVDLSSKPAISVPLSAVYKRGDHAEVRVVTPDGQQTTRSVQTGPTTIDSVTIEKGLHDGDKVLVDDQPAKNP